MADSMIDTYDDEYDDYDNEYDNDFDRVTARDIAQLLHHHAELRAGPRGDDPAERAAFLHRKADLFNRIADQAALIRTDAYVEQGRFLMIIATLWSSERLPGWSTDGRA